MGVAVLDYGPASDVAWYVVFAEILDLVRRRVAWLTFQLGRPGYYYGPAIREHLERLTRYDIFRYVVFVGGDGRFRGVLAAKRRQGGTGK